jgi:penicillin-binding protein 1B
LPVRIKVPHKTPAARRTGPSKTAAKFSRYLFYGSVGVLAILCGFVIYTYVRLAHIADEKLAHGPFPNSSVLFASPELIGVGDPGSPGLFAGRLRESGYTEDTHSNQIGWFHLRPDAIEIFPGDHSYSDAEPAVVRFSEGKISNIIALSDNSDRTQYTLEPEILSTLFDKNREKRRLVKFDDIPPVLVHAVISIEDKRFFQHSGFDPIRIIKAIFVDIRTGHKTQGASTLTQQLAKNLWLDPGKTFQRKFDELMITLHLEHKLKKDKIFEYYANQIDLGRRGSFDIRGFGEASEAFFDKSIRTLTIPEAATLAGLIQEPSYRNPVKWPDRARARRNVVLKAMLDNGYISEGQYNESVAAPLGIAKMGSESADAPYFVDVVNDRLADKLDDENFHEDGARIYTTLDTDLQRDATAAVAEGMKELDAIIEKRHRTEGGALDLPQVALICLDPHTGEVKAFVGGRNYGSSQFDHALAHRPSGSVFKPFVYAAALNSGLNGPADAITASTLFSDTPQTFDFGGQQYSPTDFHKDAWEGDVTVRTAFIKSLNVPAIEVAQRAGYRNVANLAHQAGLADIRATPSMALGTYQVTPLDMAGAYTTFANNGVFVQPELVSKIVNKEGKEIWTAQPVTKKLLDPRVNFLIVSLMQDVLNSGTGASVRARGFELPAAGKTGTSHDAWFAGFTSKLLCVVWVGLDDYQDIKMEGAKAALPIWTDFMKRASQHRAYRDVTDFPIPDGVVSAQVDTSTGSLATSSCPQSDVRNEYYLEGTQPVEFCATHMGGVTQFANWETLPSAPPMGGTNPQLPAPNLAQPDLSTGGSTKIQDPNQDNKKKGIFDKLKSIFH